MAIKELIYLGTSPDSGTGDSARKGGVKINNLFADIYANLGDNPVGNDPNGPFYGYRRPIREFEQVVGEIHGAGRFIPVSFDSDETRVVFDSDADGWGVELDGGVRQFVETDPSAAAPDIYRNTEWYFLSRGERVSLDLSNIPAGKVVHVVLPLGVAGDQVHIRDTLGTWGNKDINVWTTPYEFRDSDQVTNFLNSHRITDSEFDSDCVSITQPDGEKFACPYKGQLATGSAHRVPAVPYEHPAGNQLQSQIRFASLLNGDIVFTCRGPSRGWVYAQSSVTNVATQIRAVQDNFDSAEWVVMPQNVLDKDGGIELEAGRSYVLPLYDAGFGLENSVSSTPIVRVFRRPSADSDEFKDNLTDALQTIINDLGTLADFRTGTDDVNTNRRQRWTWIYGRGFNPASPFELDQTISGVRGFEDTLANNLYTEVSVRSIVDTEGNILLVSSEPFDGFAQIFVPVT